MYAPKALRYTGTSTVGACLKDALERAGPVRDTRWCSSYINETSAQQ